MPSKIPTVLIIRDGWGYNPSPKYNAIAMANTPNEDRFMAKYPHALVETSSLAVGLPPDTMGNSEVGHMTIGAGRVFYQDLVNINLAIEDGHFFKNQVFLDALTKVKQNKGALHLALLLSDAGVHSDINHLYAMLKMAKQEGVSKVFVHAIMDGRDTPPNSGLVYMQGLLQKLKELGVGKVATVSGRYYAMDRDQRWDRVQLAYDVYTQGKGLSAVDPELAISEAYKRVTEENKPESDEFILPTVIVENGQPVGLLKDGDVLMFLNYRPDRARELSFALVQDTVTISQVFDKKPFTLDRKVQPAISLISMTKYHDDLEVPIAFPKTPPINTLQEVLAQHNFTQLHTAETEKYAHVTFFLNGGREGCGPGEDQLLVDSPGVATYDLQPEMSAFKVRDIVLKALGEGKYDFIVVNFANGDMVGHTGILASAIKAIEAVDECVGEIVDSTLALGGKLLLTADHGNAELMVDENGLPHTQHTKTPVPIIYVGDDASAVTLRNGGLADVAPTVLAIMGLAQPAEMTGKSLLTS